MERIFIKNFKTIQNTEEKWIDLDRLTVFFGEQASGKSTVAKLVYFFKTIPNELYDIIIDSDDISEENIGKKFIGIIKSHFTQFFGTIRNFDNFEIQYEYRPNYVLNISKKSDISVKQTLLWNEIKSIGFFYVNEKKNIEKPSIKQFKKNFFEVFSFQEDALFVPASRNLMANLGGAVFSLLNGLFNRSTNNISENLNLTLLFWAKFSEIRKAFIQSGSFSNLVEDYVILGQNINKDLVNQAEKKIETILKGKYVADQTGEKITFGNAQQVYLDNASSGQQEVLPLLQDIFISLVRQNRTCKIYEEPESHLFPTAQKLLIELIVMLIQNNSQSQLIFTTHSPYILTALNNLLYASLTAAEQKKRTQEIDLLVNPFERFEVQDGKVLGLKVYFLGNGEIKNIMDQEDQLILGNYLDDVSEELNRVFHRLMNIRHD